MNRSIKFINHKRGTGLERANDEGEQVDETDGTIARLKLLIKNGVHYKKENHRLLGGNSAFVPVIFYIDDSLVGIRRVVHK